MNVKKSALLLAAVFLLSCEVINARQSESQSPAADAAAKKEAELAKIPRVTVDELKSKIAHNEPVYILDARMPDDYAKAEKKIKGAVRISPFDLMTRMTEIPKDKEVVTYCT